MSDCHGDQLEEVEALQQIYGEDVEVLCDDPGLVELVLHITPDLEKVTLRAEVERPDSLESAAPGGSESFGGAPGAPGAPGGYSAMELAQAKIAAPSQKPALARSESGKHVSHAEGEVQHLKPLRLQLKLPPAYPTCMPEFQLACCWLDGDMLTALCQSLDEKWEEAQGSPIIFTWAEALRHEAFQEGLQCLTLRAEKSSACDPRARPECTDPLQSLTDMIVYDQCRGLDLWRQQQHECNICFSEQPGSQFVHLGCRHAFCKACVTAMAGLHVKEGSINELLCPEPKCRAEISATALGEVLERRDYERWYTLKLQKVLMSELEGVVFCPRCEENGRESPVLPEGADSDTPPVARCERCEYTFCSKCLGLWHGKEPCLHPEERAQQAALRRLGKTTDLNEKRRLKREAEKGYLVCIDLQDAMLPVDAAGFITEDRDPNICAGDSVIEVHFGRPDRLAGRALWSFKCDNICNLGSVLEGASRPFTVRLRRGDAAGSSERLKQRRLMEELLTLKEIAKESQLCPQCSVRVQRSMGCNHMTCTQCRTHFCYRCGARLNAEDPYSHFRAGGCTTFDTEEVQRMAMRQRQAVGFVDDELERLRAEFGDQGNLFAQFQADRQHRGGALPPAGRRNVAQRLRQGEVQCPVCGQFNGRAGGLNHIRCGMCRNSYCGHCRRRIQGVITHHFRGEGACPQHMRTE